MRRKTYVLTLLLLVGAVYVLSAQTVGQVTERLRARGYTVENPRTEAGRPTWDLRHDEDIPFTLSMIGDLNDVRAQALEMIRESVFGLEGLQIRRIRIVFDDNRATVVVVPAAYRIDGRDYNRYMPSGMQFTYDDSLSYDFRMLAENLALRVNGQFLTEEQFNERIVRAIENPAGYIESSDPLFLARRLEEQQIMIDNTRATDIRQDQSLLNIDQSLVDVDRSLEEIDQALGALAETDQELFETIEDYVNRAERVITREIMRAERANRELRADLEQEIVDLEQEIADLTERHVKLLRDFENLLEVTRGHIAEFEAFREGAIALTGRRLFGSLREIDTDSIARVVEMRRADPELTPDDARDRVNETLPEGTPELHSRHVQAIYAVYFNEYH